MMSDLQAHLPTPQSVQQFLTKKQHDLHAPPYSPQATIFVSLCEKSPQEEMFANVEEVK